jgi:hypothetical protein
MPVSARNTWFRPACFALYKALSAANSSSTASCASSGNVDTPPLTETFPIGCRSPNGNS